MEQQHRKAVALTEQLFGNDFDAGGISPLEPDLGFAFLALGPLLRSEPVVAGDRVVRRRLANPERDEW